MMHKSLCALATSSDGGVTWVERRIDGAFDYANAPLVEAATFSATTASSGTSFLTAFGRATADPGNRSDIAASLARPASQTTAIAAGADDPGTPPSSARTATGMRKAIDDALCARKRARP